METATLPEQAPDVSDADLAVDLAALVSTGEVDIRGAVSIYYDIQKSRLAAANRMRAAKAAGESYVLMETLRKRFGAQEAWVKRCMDLWSTEQPMGRWLRNVYGIGPVIAAGMQAHIDITRLGSVSALWRYAGYDPSVIWPSQAEATAWISENVKGDTIADAEYVLAARHFGRTVTTLRKRTEFGQKGDRRKASKANLAKALRMIPWNPDLKVLTWKASSSFKTRCNNEKCFYGRIYREFKAEEVARNESGHYEAAAQRIVDGGRYKRDTKARAAYRAGKLPPGHLDARALRRVGKLFLSHYWQAARKIAGLAAPDAWALAHGGHADKIHDPQQE